MSRAHLLTEVGWLRDAVSHMGAMGKALGWCVLPIVLLVCGALWDKPNGGQAAPAGVVPAAGLSRGRR